MGVGVGGIAVGVGGMGVFVDGITVGAIVVGVMVGGNKVGVGPGYVSASDMGDATAVVTTSNCTTGAMLLAPGATLQLLIRSTLIIDRMGKIERTVFEYGGDRFLC